MGAQKMVRKQVYIEARQEAVLKQRSKELGITEAELIRRCIDDGLPKDGDADRRKALGELRAMWADRAALQAPQTGREWTRDGIYEERLGRKSR
ncbi:MAG: hypothetical protein JO247_01920 [Chloroflexi bacterium]|nr:hypothetical protein [Chloroflexota bacterium]